MAVPPTHIQPLSLAALADPLARVELWLVQNARFVPTTIPGLDHCLDSGVEGEILNIIQRLSDHVGLKLNEEGCIIGRTREEGTWLFSAAAHWLTPLRLPTVQALPYLYNGELSPVITLEKGLMYAFPPRHFVFVSPGVEYLGISAELADL